MRMWTKACGCGRDQHGITICRDALRIEQAIHALKTAHYPAGSPRGDEIRTELRPLQQQYRVHQGREYTL